MYINAIFDHKLFSEMNSDSQNKVTIENSVVMSREGSQRKSSVERSGTEIAAKSLTRSFYGGSRPNKKEKPQSKSYFEVF